MANLTRNSRAASIVVDEFGVDPLRDRTHFQIVNIPAYTTYLVTQEERGRPDLISFRAYQTVHLWWVILAYNRMYSYREVVEGTVLRIPVLGSVIKALGTASAKPLKTITI